MFVANEIDPLQDKRFTVSGGTLVISEPDSVRRGGEGVVGES